MGRSYGKGGLDGRFWKFGYSFLHGNIKTEEDVVPGIPLPVEYTFTLQGFRIYGKLYFQRKHRSKPMPILKQAGKTLPKKGRMWMPGFV